MEKKDNSFQWFVRIPGPMGRAMERALIVVFLLAVGFISGSRWEYHHTSKRVVDTLNNQLLIQSAANLEEIQKWRTN